MCSFIFSNFSKSVSDLTTLSKTYWPIPYIELIFLPHFEIVAHHTNSYNVEQLLERGAFGVVYRVTEKNNSANSDCNQKSYALKVLSKSQV